MDTIIVGKGAAGLSLSVEIKKSEDHNLIGFVDDNKSDVLGKIIDLPIVIENYKVEVIYIAMPSVDKDVITEICELVNQADVKVKILPSFADIIQHGNVSLAKTKKMEIADLLGRPLVKQDFNFIKGQIRGKSILISGAAGSIGSELSYQVALSDPEKLICLDKAETPLFRLQHKLKQFDCVDYVIGDLMNEVKLNQIFEQHNVDIVLHAAAYKHVPLMEDNPDEAIRNNIQGSDILLRAACEHKIPNIVLVSTDKAVNPTNVMGASKRVVEKLMEYYTKVFPSSKISAVRFGNVIKSDGSVIQMFEERIKEGKSLPVTHKEITRFFMTVEEAAQLILISAFQGATNEIFILDMGEPIKIADLAKKMILLSGKTPFVEIGISYVGLRPGEKLYEEILVNKASAIKTKNKKLFIAKKEEAFEVETFFKDMSWLLLNLASLSNKDIKEYLIKLVPTYSPSAHETC